MWMASTQYYYISVVIFQSVFFAVMLRYWSPFTNAPVLFTDKLWRKGKDEFIDLDVDPPVFREIDLFQWLHLTTKQRLTHCALYARRIGLDSIQSKADEDIDNIEVGVKQVRKWREKEDAFYNTYNRIVTCRRNILSCGHARKRQPEHDEENMVVVSLKKFKGNKDFVWRNINGDQIVEIKKVEVPINTKGTIKNKTAGGNFLVEWELSSGRETLEIEPLYVAELTPEWSQFMKDSNLISLRAALVD